MTMSLYNPRESPGTLPGLLDFPPNPTCSRDTNAEMGITSPNFSGDMLRNTLRYQEDNLPSISSNPSLAPSPASSSWTGSSQEVENVVSPSKKPIPPVVLSHRCPHCSFAGLDITRLKRHLKSHRSIQCNFQGCKKLFIGNRELYRHLNNVHKQGPASKARCGRQMRKDNILRHERTCKLCKDVGEEFQVF